MHYLVAFLFNIIELQAGCIIIIVNGKYMFAYEWVYLNFALKKT